MQTEVQPQQQQQNVNISYQQDGQQYATVFMVDPWEKYERLERIGQGSHGVVYSVREIETGTILALKLLNRGQHIDQNLERELLNHRMLEPHPNIIGFKEVLLTPTHLGIVLEYASHGELFRRVREARRLHENLARFYFQQIITGMVHLHSSGVCHRDIKLENTLVKEENGVPVLKICDFGFSKWANRQSQPDTRVGTPSYVAPEVVRHEPRYDGARADMWSIGVMLYVMLVGRYPFEDPRAPHDMRSTVDRIVQGRYTIPDDVNLSSSCRHLLSKLLVTDPNQRLSVHEVKQHEWFLESLPDEISQNYPPGCVISYPPPSTQQIEEIQAVIVAAQQEPG